MSESIAEMHKDIDFLKSMVGNPDIDFEAIRAAWKIPANMRFIPQYERDLKC